MDRKEIMDILPHRNSMLLLDEVQESGGVAVGHYRVRGDEFFLDGHSTSVSRREWKKYQNMAGFDSERRIECGC